MTGLSGEPLQIDVVPHTHWDREWYDPFQTFRLKLVHLVDDLLDLLEGDPSFAEFLLDGQVAIIDDYLAIRPENEERLRSLAAAGRLTVGPWYVLMDEFLVSGETIIRDLQAGIRRGAAFGGVMDVGYLPDMFGHIAQMPQILRQAGFEHTVVWRGVPSVVDTTAFWWEAPDGSRVRAEYLVAGYGNGAAIPDDAKALVRRLNAHAEEMGPFLQPGAPLLFMNGTDHQRPQPWLGRVIAEVNEIQDDYHLAITSLPEYLADAPTDGLPSWRGELRSGVRSNLLMGVGSNRGRRKASRSPDRASPRAPGRAPLRPLPRGTGVARRLLGCGLAERHPQRGARLDLRLLGGRGGGGGHPSVRRGPPSGRGSDRRGPGRRQSVHG